MRGAASWGPRATASSGQPGRVGVPWAVPDRPISPVTQPAPPARAQAAQGAPCGPRRGSGLCGRRRGRDGSHAGCTPRCQSRVRQCGQPGAKRDGPNWPPQPPSLPRSGRAQAVQGVPARSCTWRWTAWGSGSRVPPPPPLPPPYKAHLLAPPARFPAPAAIHETPFGEFIPLSEKAGVPVLVRLHERPWGALARLPPEKLVEAGYEGGWAAACCLSGCCRSACRAAQGKALRSRSRCWHRSTLPPPACAGSSLPSHVAVVRDAFGAHDDSHRRLGQEVAALGPDKVGSAAVSTPSSRPLLPAPAGSLAARPPAAARRRRRCSSGTPPRTSPAPALRACRPAGTRWRWPLTWRTPTTA